MKKEKPTRETLPKAIVAAFKSGDKNKALDLAIYGREKNVLTDLARDLYWFFRVQQNPGLKKVAASGGGERHGWEPPRRQSAKVRTQSFVRWKQCQLAKLESQLAILSKTDPHWLKKLQREFVRVSKKDTTVFLFNAPGNTKSEANNPSWFRQILIANIGLKSLLGREPFPLLQVAKQFKVPVRTLRREARKMGAKPRKAGRPIRVKDTPLI